jgi:signal transduction histidine kinase
MFRTLRTRLILAFASVTLVSLLVALVGFLFLIQDREVSAARLRLAQLATPVSSQVQNLGQQGATESQIALYLEQEARALQVRFLLLDSNSRVLDDTGGALEGQTLDLSRREDLRLAHSGTTDFGFVSQQVAGERVVFIQPSPFVQPTPALVASVVPVSYRIVMAVPEEELSTVWRQLAPRILIAAGAGLLLAVLLSLLIARSIVRPLGRMTRASEEMARGHYQQRIESTRKDEVGRLAAAFNAMASEVNHSDQMMRDLLANVAHELKTPLTSIQGFSQALMDGAVHSPEEYERAGRIINEEAERMRRLVEDLLYLSQIESGQVRMEHGVVDVGRLLEHSVERASRRALEGGQVLELLAPPHLPAVLGDERRLEQVLANLLDNALRYTPRGGIIRVEAKRDGEEIAFSVHNSGSYIPPEAQSRVFERFYRVERSRSGRNGGLGLAIVSEIVVAHGGRVDVSSDPESGTTFRFRLPAVSGVPMLLAPTHA